MKSVVARLPFFSPNNFETVFGAIVLYFEQTDAHFFHSAVPFR